MLAVFRDATTDAAADEVTMVMVESEVMFSANAAATAGRRVPP